ncbi:MAG: dihydroorotate dehydrogenase [Deltaproteobacteria bacterium]|nr:dihydroorotate dehydrogenase [Deltaproteobacteria bacterium]
MVNVRDIKTAVKIGSLVLKNPVMPASGTFGYGEEFASFVDYNLLGAIVVKGLSLEPRAGNPPPRIIETTGGMLNAIGMENIGVHAFIKEKLPFLAQFNCAVIANVYGETVEEYQKVAEILSGAKGVHALEINISCPNVKKGGIAFGTDPDTVHDITGKVKQATNLPVIVKLSPNVTDIAEIAVSAQDAGADAVSLINTLTGMSVDIISRTSNIANLTGGLSGPAIKPIALRMVWEVAKKVSIPIIGIGGIMSPEDAVEFLIVGASAIQVGTANLINPLATMDILEGILAYLEVSDIMDIKDLVGSLKTERPREE